ncbi:MAG: hypothetical protein IJG62_01890 [Synergistaceae bacterium]|nr:hypothetical protein [Synergistaceae bacterium]MBQ3627330.1 hypothetical protein [Synergistaceae bacterium]MBQ6740925.1 hypothetical protein [Synergistaceae bacterium]MBR0045085.1 hypothetical protein [Synergistaceae bacterium]MBR0221410.1 hypothetical protein [Synergistaceae bacterium]
MKDDSMTNLYGPELVSKTDPRIELRGKLDELNARIILLQTQAGEAKNLLLYTDMDIIHKNFEKLRISEVKGTPCGDLELWGFSEEEIHERSHNPKAHYGLGHIMPHADMGRWAAELNLLRTITREVEICACKAYPDNERPDIIKYLNRLSSAFYILIYKYLPEDYDKVIYFAR